MGVVGFLRGLVGGVVWLTLALLIALGTAGIVSAMNQPPGSPGRSELTAAGDAQLKPALDSAARSLESLSDEVDQLSTIARGALSQVVAGDIDSLQQTISDGTSRLGRVEALAEDLETALAGLPYTGDAWALHVSADLHRRYLQLAGTAGLTTGLEEDWAALTGRSLAASQLSTLLSRHDTETAAAAQLGSKGRFRDAIAKLDESDETIAASRQLRDSLARSSDVATLTSWLDRNAAYDAALRDLYQALIKSDARVTEAVRKAIDRELAARAQLPADTRALVVIMSDIAQGGLNQAVIAIEEVRGSLAQALEDQQQLRDGPESPSPG